MDRVVSPSHLFWNLFETSGSLKTTDEFKIQLKRVHQTYPVFNLTQFYSFDCCFFLACGHCTIGKQFDICSHFSGLLFFILYKNLFFFFSKLTSRSLFHTVQHLTKNRLDWWILFNFLLSLILSLSLKILFHKFPVGCTIAHQFLKQKNRFDCSLICVCSRKRKVRQ